MAANPNTHRCGLRDLSYEQVDEGLIWCKECGRIYDRGEYGWVPDPKPPMTEAQKAAQRAKFAGPKSNKTGSKSNNFTRRR